MWRRRSFCESRSSITEPRLKLTSQSRECVNASAAGGRACYNCGEPGHEVGPHHVRIKKVLMISPETVPMTKSRGRSEEIAITVVSRVTR